MCIFAVYIAVSNKAKFKMIKITESPRDAMQGIKNFIPTDDKILYINKLLQVGFDVIDFGSFVSPRAIPQLRDTAAVLEKLDLSGTNTRLLAIVANTWGAQMAASFEKISFLGFPFSISPTFLRLNINSSTAAAYRKMETTLSLCRKNNKQFIAYLAMAFGNPYGDAWNMEIVEKNVSKLVDMGVTTISFSDTTGIARAEVISQVFSHILPRYPQVEFNFHLHTQAARWHEKLHAAYQAGCRSFDTVLNGMGGCPMSKKELVANLNTFNFISYLDEQKIAHHLNFNRLNEALEIAEKIM